MRISYFNNSHFTWLLSAIFKTGNNFLNKCFHFIYEISFWSYSQVIKHLDWEINKLCKVFLFFVSIGSPWDILKTLTLGSLGNLRYGPPTPPPTPPQPPGSRGPPNTGQKVKIITVGWKLVHNIFLGRGTQWKRCLLAILKISLGFGQFLAKNDQIWAFGIGKFDVIYISWH